MAARVQPAKRTEPICDFGPAGYAITAPDSVLNQIPADSLAVVRTQIAGENQAIADSNSVMLVDGTTVPGTRSLLPVAGKYSMSWKIRGPHGYIKSHWYGYEVGLDAYATNKAEGAHWTGSGVAAGAALLGGGVIATAVATGLAISAGAVQVCQHSNGWTYLYWLKLPNPYHFPAYGWVCNPFG